MDKSIASKLCIFNDQKFSQFGENHFINNALTHCWVKCINTFTVKSSVITLKYHLLVALTKVSFSKLSFPVVSIFQLISIMSFYLSLSSLSLSPLSLSQPILKGKNQFITISKEKYHINWWLKIKSKPDFKIKCNKWNTKLFVLLCNMYS